MYAYIYVCIHTYMSLCICVCVFLSQECVGSVCHQIDWEECFLTDDQDHHVSGHGGVSGGDVASRPSPEAMCYVSCRELSPLLLFIFTSFFILSVFHCSSIVPC